MTQYIVTFKDRKTGGIINTELVWKSKNNDEILKAAKRAKEHGFSYNPMKHFAIKEKKYGI
jgi:hypothetical protein